jgi:hypothetical protein
MVGDDDVGRGVEKIQRSRMRQPGVWVALAVVVGVLLILFVLWIGPWLFTRHPSSDLTDAERLKAQNDVRTTLVQAVAGVAVAGGAIVTYRTFRHTQAVDRSRQVSETYAKAVEQLGHDQAPVRLGALYSLASLAQENPPRRHTVAAVICAYLRMPHIPPTQDELGTESGPEQQLDQEKRHQAAAQELQVRQTAQRIVAGGGLYRFGETLVENGHSAEERSVPPIMLNLTGATLVDFIMLERPVVNAIFDRATFVGYTYFNEAMFLDPVSFQEANFSGPVWFDEATFKSVAPFYGATFSDTASFRAVTFSDRANFVEVKFRGPVSFEGATFSGRGWFHKQPSPTELRSQRCGSRTSYVSVKRKS